MAEYSTIPVSLRIIVLLLVIAFLLILGFVVISSLGIFDARGLLTPFYKLFGISSPTPVDTTDPLLLVHQREMKNRDALDLREQELDLKEKDLSSREAQVGEKEGILSDKEKSLTEMEKSLNQDTKSLDDRRRRLEQESLQFRSMPPENAVKILNEMDIEEVIEVLRVTDELANKENEQSIVPYWQSLMPPDRVAKIQRMWR
ncbi:MAG: flagellar protein FlbB [Spirochaetales bacterium]|nr:flagellar protein FlbB [Spirochaetales bacterium]